MEITPQRIAQLATVMNGLPHSELLSAALMAGIDSTEYVLHGGTPKDIAVKLAEVASQKGTSTFLELERRVRRTSSERSDLKPIHQTMVVQFGGLLEHLLERASQLGTNPAVQKSSPGIKRLEDKLREANIEGTLFDYAKRCKNDMAFIRREAEKIGFQGYDRLQKRLQAVFANVVEYQCPRPPNTPEDQYHHFLALLFDHCVPEEYQEQAEIYDLLAGVIFDTVAHCVIRWDKRGEQ